MNPMLESLQSATTDPRFWMTVVVALSALTSTIGALFFAYRTLRGGARLAAAGVRWMFAHGELCRQILDAIDGADQHTPCNVLNDRVGMLVRCWGTKGAEVNIRGESVWHLLTRREQRTVLGRARAIHARLAAADLEWRRRRAAVLLAQEPAQGDYVGGIMSTTQVGAERFDAGDVELSIDAGSGKVCDCSSGCECGGPCDCPRSRQSSDMPPAPWTSTPVTWSNTPAKSRPPQKS